MKTIFFLMSLTLSNIVMAQDFMFDYQTPTCETLISKKLYENAFQMAEKNVQHLAILENSTCEFIKKRDFGNIMYLYNCTDINENQFSIKAFISYNFCKPESVKLIKIKIKEH
jgi:hypothetical protein